jgi:hypothetical protein
MAFNLTINQKTVSVDAICVFRALAKSCCDDEVPANAILNG